MNKDRIHFYLLRALNNAVAGVISAHNERSNLAFELDCVGATPPRWWEPRWLLRRRLQRAFEGAE